jgi:hypothetical protein
MEPHVSLRGRRQNIGRKRWSIRPSWKLSIIIMPTRQRGVRRRSGARQVKKGYEKLLTTSATKARFILMSPPPLETKGRPLPDPAAQNSRLAIYRVAIQEIAEARGHAFADLFAVMGEGKEPLKGLTDNGVHFTDAGYKQTTGAFAKALGISEDAATSIHSIRCAFGRQRTNLLPQMAAEIRRTSSASASTSRARTRKRSHSSTRSSRRWKLRLRSG